MNREDYTNKFFSLLESKDEEGMNKFLKSFTDKEWITEEDDCNSIWFNTLYKNLKKNEKSNPRKSLRR